MDSFNRRRRDQGPSIGSDVDAPCGRCKRDVGHTITAMVGSTIAQVQCNSCHSIHKYRPTQEEKDRKARGVSKVARVSADVKKYRRLLADRDPDEAYKHNMFRRPAEGDLILHKKFGLGYVQSVAADKAEVLFADCKRTIVVCR